MSTVILITALKVSVFWVFLNHIFLHSNWVRRDTPYLFISSPNAGKYGSEKLRIRKLITQWLLLNFCPILHICIQRTFNPFMYNTEKWTNIKILRPQDFYSMFDHLLRLCTRGLKTLQTNNLMLSFYGLKTWLYW